MTRPRGLVDYGARDEAKAPRYPASPAFKYRPYTPMLNGQFQKPAPTEHDGFDDSRFDQGEEVEVVLRHRKSGYEYGRAQGTTIMRRTGADVSHEGEETRRKTLIQLKGLVRTQGKKEGETYKDGEAWFAEEAIRKKDGDLLDDVSFN